MICGYDSWNHCQASHPVTCVIVVHFRRRSQNCDCRHEARHKAHRDGKYANIPASHQYVFGGSLPRAQILFDDVEYSNTGGYYEDGGKERVVDGRERADGIPWT